MLNELRYLAQYKGSKTFFYAQVDARRSGGLTRGAYHQGVLTFSYRQTRFAAAALAREIEKRGLASSGAVACNLFNGPEFVFLVFAAAYGGFTLATLNPRLSEEEQLLRKTELEASYKTGKIEVLDEARIDRLLLEGMGISLLDLAHLDGVVPAYPRALEVMDYAQAREEAFRGHSRGRSDELKNQGSQGSVIMFTSGTSGTPKATPLSWDNLTGAARSANEALMTPGKGIWQLVLPLYHIGGLQVMVRSLLNHVSFILYSRYQPLRILNDALTYKVSHISVVDKILVDLLEADQDRIISTYQCILLGGAALNQKTARKALRARAKVFASYGMTETSSMIACAPVQRGFDGGLKLLPGYDVRIMRPDNEGVGSLHVQGPGVFKGYLNARGAFSADGWFVTGDRAVMDKEKFLYVFARTEDLIISGGENIYPAEIREALLKVPGVKDAYVFGTADETWGYRPVAFIQADYSATALAEDHAEAGLDEAVTGIHAATCPQEFARMVHRYLEPKMSHLHHPKHILVLADFPRTGVGKTDTRALKQLYDQRIDIKNVSLYRIKQPFVTPVKTSQHTVEERESFFVEIEDWAGRIGVAECVSFATNWYLPETIGQDFAVVKERIAPLIMSERYLHPREVSASLATFPALAAYPMAKAAVEPAFWDLYGKIVGLPLHELLRREVGGASMAGVTGMGVTDADRKNLAGKAGGSANNTTDTVGTESVLDVTGANRAARVSVPGGVVIGIMSTEDTLAAVDAAVSAGYRRVKIKISPDSALEKIRLVREQYPDLSIFLDANQSFTEESLDVLHKFDPLDITCIEEPLDPSYVPRQGAMSLLDRLSLLQETLKTPICLDESVVTAEEMQQAMEFSNLRCFAVKIAKFGGVKSALDFCEWAHAHNASVWMGGMFDTGVSKRLHAAFETLDWVSLSGDISDYTQYFVGDTALPALVLDGGVLQLNPDGYEAGLGCELDKEYLAQHLIDEVHLVG